MKRFFLTVLAVFGVVLAASYVAVNLWGTEILGLMLRPGADFDPGRSPAAPDYSQAWAWAARPETEDPADLVSEGGATPEAQASAPADVFFVHPTTYYASDRWNGPTDDPRAKAMTAVTMAGQASAFNGCCRVFAPRYRQAAIGAYLENDANSLAAFRLAYGDVKAAFEHYLEHDNAGRPFILASHSQGTMHALRLLEELADSPARERLISAYLVGYRLPVALLKERLPGVPVCEGPEATGCLVGWDTHTEEGDPDFEIAYLHWQGDALVSSRGVPRLCVNPLTWRQGEEPAPAAAHLGATTIRTAEPFPGMLALMFGEEEQQKIEVTGLGAPRPASFGARCVGSRLMIPTQPEPYETMNAGGSYHIYDYDLFYEDVRANAVRRVEAFLAGRAQLPGE
ncbi:MAG: DUF3089 domain-containing protein [Deltaproteobacteria bacterium]|nr:DUF3089 domain-containing protein [Deltaproteobacteria bacterium]